MLTSELKSRRKTYEMFYKIFDFLFKLHAKLLRPEHTHLSHAPRHGYVYVRISSYTCIDPETECCLNLRDYLKWRILSEIQ